MPNCISCACCAFDLVGGHTCHAQGDISLQDVMVDAACSLYIEVELIAQARRRIQLHDFERRYHSMPQEERSCLTCGYVQDWDEQLGCFCSRPYSGCTRENGHRIAAHTARGPHHCDTWTPGNNCRLCAHYHEATDFCTARYRLTTPAERDRMDCDGFVQSRDACGNSSELPGPMPCLTCAYGWPAIDPRGRLMDDMRVCHHHGCSACGKTIDQWSWTCEQQFASLRQHCPHYDTMLDLTQEVEYTTDHPYRI